MSQNINIKYNVDSSQVTASTAQVNAAKAATDKLTDSATKLGQTGSKNNIQFGNTIEGVRLKVQQLKAQIDLTNQTDTKRLNSLISQYKQAQSVLTSYTDKLKQSNDEANKGNTSVAKSFGDVYTAIKLIIASQLAKQFVTIAVEAAALSGKVEGVERAFNRAFPQGVSLLNDLRVATHGTVTDFELMQQTLRATNLGVAVEKLPILLEFAAARAQQTGESVDYLVDSIVRGIGRKSVLVLDNLGLSATRLKEQFDGASIASQSVGDVTTAVAKIAKEELEKMGGYVDTNATKVDRLKAAWTNLGIEASKAVSGQGGIIEKLKGYVDAFETIIEAQNRGISVSDLLRERSVAESAQIGINIIKEREFTESRENNLRVTREIIAEKTHELIEQQQEIKNLEDRQKALLKIQAIENVGPEFRKNKQQIADDIYANQLLVAQIKLLQGIAKELDINIVSNEKQVDSLQVLEDKLKDLQDQILNLDGISTQAGIKRATELQNQANDVQTQIDKIKEQINWEQVLRDRRAKAKDSDKVIDITGPTRIGNETIKKVTVTIDKDKAETDLNNFFVDAQGKFTNLKLTLPTPTVPESEWDKIKDSFSEHIQDVEGTLQNIIADQVQASVNNVQNGYQAMIRATQLYYDNQISLAGDNEKAKQKLRLEEQKRIDAIRKQQFEAQKLANEKAALINGAVAVARAFADYQYPYSLVVAALAGAQVLSQVGIIENTTYTPQGFAKGVIKLQGKGSATSDSIPARLSVGESVMTAQETSTSEKTLRMIRAKKLNDEVLDRIMFKAGSNGNSIGFDDSRLLAATKRVEKAAAGNDIVRKGAHIYEAKKQGDNLKIYVRSKYLS